MSSDDEDFVVFGTPLETIEEDSVVRKKSKTVEDQVAKDKYGRRRFHGAFTGGFSAGYFNSVGSAEGWTPSAFKSSRGSKIRNQSQKPEDFMDDEDMGEFGIAPKVLRLKGDYDGSEDCGQKKRKHFVGSEGPIPGQPVLQTILEPIRSTVGVILLKKMGWKVGQGIGPRMRKHEKRKQRQENKSQSIKIYGCALPSAEESIQPHPDDSCESDFDDGDNEDITFAPDDYDPYIVKPKDNFFGIGYSGLDRRSVLSSHINLFQPSFTVKEKSKKFSIRGQGFGVGALEEEDEDIYSHDEMSQYDFSLDAKPSSSSSSSTKQQNKQLLAIASASEPIEGFVAACTIIRKKNFPPPRLPPGFQPVHMVRKSRFEPAQVRPEDKTKKKGLHRHDLSANERALIILDEPISHSIAAEQYSQCSSTGEVSLGSYENDDDDDNTIQSVKIKTEPLESDSSHDVGLGKVFKPFVSVPEKQRRYEQYLKLVKNGQKDKLSVLQPLSMTEWERDRERIEFEQAERLYRPISAVFNDRFVSASQPDDSNNPLAEVQRTVDNQKDLKEAAKKKMFGQLTRKVYSWAPSSLLCKRFNIREPNSSKEFDSKQVGKKRPKFSVFNFLEAATLNAISASDIASSSSSTLTNSHDNGTRITTDVVNEDVIVTEIETILNKEGQLSSDENGKMTMKLEDSNEAMVLKELDLGGEANKEDLYKAIFLSSSDESEDEEKEKCSANIAVNKSSNTDHLPKQIETNESQRVVLCSQPASLFNTLRNTSPPRGIFANLDLDLINSIKSNSSNVSVNSNSELSTKNEDKVNDVSKDKQVDVVNEINQDSCITSSLLYGPTLPTKLLNSDKETSNIGNRLKNIVGYKSDESNNEWVESEKISKKHKNKKKKDKKEHNHKKHKKHKKHKH